MKKAQRRLRLLSYGLLVLFIYDHPTILIISFTLFFILILFLLTKLIHYTLWKKDKIQEIEGIYRILNEIRKLLEL